MEDHSDSTTVAAEHPRTASYRSDLDRPPPLNEDAHMEWLNVSQLYKKRRAGVQITNRRSSVTLQRRNTSTGGRRWWKFEMRSWDDDEEQDWWFASTAIPLLAAAIGPLANVLSIAALVTEWRMCLVPGSTRDTAAQCVWNGDMNSLGPELEGVSYADPHWCYGLNLASLVVGFVGNFFLLCNFTGRIRYIVALPVSIVMWYVATGLLIGITVSMHLYVPPHFPQQTYTQGFWYAVIAACLYLVCSMILMFNMLGYALGHYPQQFNLTESQRTLILQTMLFFLWLAGGGAVFSAVEQRYGTGGFNWSYVNSLYFCDVTILTVGFGDQYPTNDIARGLVFPYSVGGIIMLGLVASSISRFAKELSSDKIIRKHVENSRARTFGRSVTSEQEMEDRRVLERGQRPPISAPILQTKGRSKTIQIAEPQQKPTSPSPESQQPMPFQALRRVATLVTKPGQNPRKSKLLLLREEKDRFDAMRHIQLNTTKFKNWYALCFSTLGFALLWCVGALVFWVCERNVQGMTYFEALYFCYVSLLTIGYGDLAPKSNPGRPFFVLWSLVAVPTMTILVSDLGETVVHKFKQGTFKLADFTVLPRHGVWREFLERHPWMLLWLQARRERNEAKRRLEEGFQAGPAPDEVDENPTIEELAKDEPSHDELARRLAIRIRQTANDMKSNPKKRYAYEEWVDITRLIRFTTKKPTENGLEIDEEAEGLIEWDWIGEDSPMMSRGSEAEFVLDRLCESMHRFIRHTAAFMPTTSLDRSADEKKADLSEKGKLDDSPTFNRNFTFD